jgi:hypothetical protein
VAASFVGRGVGVGPPPNGHGISPSFQLARIATAITARKDKIMMALRKNNLLGKNVVS